MKEPASKTACMTGRASGVACGSGAIEDAAHDDWDCHMALNVDDGINAV